MREKDFLEAYFVANDSQLNSSLLLQMHDTTAWALFPLYSAGLVRLNRLLYSQLHRGDSSRPQNNPPKKLHFMYIVRHEKRASCVMYSGSRPQFCLFLSEFSLEYCCFPVVGGRQPFYGHIKSSRTFFTARSRMLVFIDECGFFYCLASNNTLC